MLPGPPIGTDKTDGDPADLIKALREVHPTAYIPPGYKMNRHMVNASTERFGSLRHKRHTV